MNTTLQSNWGVARQHALFYKGGTGNRRPRPCNLPTPSEYFLRFEIASMKAKHARLGWLAARIATLEKGR